MPFIIYRITNLANGNCYIGVTKKTAEQRFKEHVYAALKRNTDRKLYHAIRKYGADMFAHEAICTVLDEAHALEMEAHFIKEYDSFNTGYNMNEGGYGLRYHSEETKAKMSQNNHWRGKARSGHANPMFGRGHTEEAKQKQSEIQKALREAGLNKGHSVPHSEEAKRKISEANKGKPGTRNGVVVSEETKRKQSEAARMRDSSTRVRNTYEVTFPDGHTEFVPNMVKFCDEYSLNIKEMRKIAKGKAKTHKKFVCREVSPK